MPRACTICTHSQRDEIETALVNGTPYRNIVKQYGGSPATLTRHATDHIKQAVKASHAARSEAQALDVVQQLKAINSVTLAILKESRDAKKNGLALFAIDRVQKQLELQAKLLGDINDAPQVNVWLPAPWQAIEEAIALALRPYPAAAAAVASALLQLDEGGHAKLN